MSKVTDAIMLAKEVIDQGGGWSTRLGGNCPTIGQVIERAKGTQASAEEHRELDRCRYRLLYGVWPPGTERFKGGSKEGYIFS